MVGHESLTQDDDTSLVARLRHADEAALGLLYDRFSGLVHGVAWRVTGDRHAAEEVCQQVFLYAWGHADAFDGARASLRGWLLMLTHRRAVDWVRHESVRRRPVWIEQEEVASAEDTAIAAAIAARVKAAVDSLPEAHRQVVSLLYFEELTVRELAVRLGIPEGTAKTRLRIARHRLAERLGSEGLVSAR